MYCMYFGLLLIAGLLVLDQAHAGYAPKKYKVRSIVSPPFVNKPDAKGQYTGFIIDILNGMKNDGAKDFDYELSVRSDQLYGDFYENGTVTGLIDDVKNGIWDFTAADLSVTQNRSRVVDFTKVFFLSTTRTAVNANFNNATVKYYLIPSSPLVTYLNKTKIVNIQRLYSRIQANPDSNLDTPQKIAAVVNRMVAGENLAIVGGTSALRLALAGHTDKLFLSSGAFFANSYSFAVKLGSDLRKYLVLKLLRLEESGYTESLLQKYFQLLCTGAARPAGVPATVNVNVTGTNTAGTGVAPAALF